MIGRIFELQELSELTAYLATFDNQNELRQDLIDEFLKVADYKNADDWNKVVRLCECLAIVGWGELVPLQAIAGTFISGSPTTCLEDKYGNYHFVEAMWSKRKNGVTLANGGTSYHQSPNQLTNQTSIKHHHLIQEDVQNIKLLSQRNWIVKAPIHIRQWLANCYQNSKFILNDLWQNLSPLIDNTMRPELYGKNIQFIRINVFLSYPNCNFIITDNETAQDLDKFDKPSPRFKYGNFIKKKGIANIDVFLEKEFSELSQKEQKAQLAKYFLIAIQNFAKKYQKKLDYDFDLMIDDFDKVLAVWVEK